ncbi:PPE domain-containing protein [Nocardia xishanensis]|uniref:PPE domain-containing protein n=1 Tax=Nocardia xishanensis TaxID=238964 RepID=UPI0008305721|nr:PPE domain-containing protein [Nocardia xishanensis]
MTAGITGVFWLPRMAEANSAALHAGAHAIPISAAATAWGGLTAAWVDATATVTRVMAELGVGMQGVNGIAALSRLVGFTGWAEQQGVMAAAMGSKAAANATAYTVAALTMPSPPEIIATVGAVMASANPPGAVSGALEAAEVAKHAMDIRAALVMETYEAATSVTVSTPGEFYNPPPIANGAGSADPAAAESSFQGDPVQSAIATAVSVVNNPAVASVATQVANVAGTVATGGVSTVGNIGANAIAAVTSAAAPSVAPAAPVTMMAGGMAGVGATAAATRSATFGSGAAVNLNNGTLKLPEGWGSGLPTNAPAATPVAEVIARVDAAPVRPANGNPAGSPLLGNTRGAEDDESVHKGADYLRGDHFTDGRFSADGVIGADPAGTAK